MKKRLSLVAILLTVCLPMSVRLQEPQSAPSVQSQETFRPSSALSSVDNQGIRNYLLGPGDIVDVRVFGQPDLSSVAEIDSDGNLSSLPFLETPIPARCRTEKRCKEILPRLRKVHKNAQVNVASRTKDPAPPQFSAVNSQPAFRSAQIRRNSLVVVSGDSLTRFRYDSIAHDRDVSAPARRLRPIQLKARHSFSIVNFGVEPATRFQSIHRPGDSLVPEAERLHPGSVLPQGMFSATSHLSRPSRW